MKNTTKSKPLLLCILDGLGYREERNGNAWALAKTPVLDALDSSVPSRLLWTHGQHVGLPEGQMGNSEVGHLNIGAGRVIEQDLVRINRELRSGEAFQSKAFQRFRSQVPAAAKIHLLGLCSNGGVHSSFEHLEILLKTLPTLFANQIVLHWISDGRDVPPDSALADMQRIVAHLPQSVTIGTVSGRYYAMDRDQRWQRIELAVEALTAKLDPYSETPLQYLAQCYSSGITDEFIPPAHFVGYTGINVDDVFLLWNYRADRMREICQALFFPERIPAAPVSDTSLEPEYLFNAPIVSTTQSLCFTEYDESFDIPVLFTQSEIRNALGEVLAKEGCTQLRIAETEKYPHVTYFLSGGQEATLPGETRLIIPSPRDVATYDQKPEMSAAAVGQKVREAISSGKYDVIIVNFANPDMVGHTGNLKAAVKAVECVDTELGATLEVLRSAGGQALIFADHGNAEQMFQSDGSPHTFHTTNPVKIWYVGSEVATFREGEAALCDIAPTALALLGIEQPVEMTGKVLLNF
jgi:2,3-bisphosphoglycerate-independent phosphoglycerate mutase